MYDSELAAAGCQQLTHVVSARIKCDEHRRVISNVQPMCRQHVANCTVNQDLANRLATRWLYVGRLGERDRPLGQSVL